MTRKWARVLLVFLAASIASCTQAQEPSVAEVESLLAVPSDDEISSGVYTLKELFPEDYRRTQNKDKVQAQFASLSLARKLLKTADDTPVDSDGYYPMLSESIRLATIGNKPELGFQAIERLAQSHAIDAPAKQLKVLEHFAKKETRITDVRAASEFVLNSVQEAADAQKLDTAQTIVLTGDTIAKRTFDRKLQRSLAQAKELLETLKQQETGAIAALQTIKNAPDDPDANLTLAKFLGLRKGDWEGAEVHAARVDEDEVRSLFVREVAAPKDPIEILKLANDWWKFAETQKRAEKLQAVELAASRYVSIFDDLKGFEKQRVETRLKDVIREHVIAVRMPFKLKASTALEWPTDVIVAMDFETATSGNSEIVNLVDDSRSTALKDQFGAGRSGVGLVLRRSPVTIDAVDLPVGNSPRTLACWLKVHETTGGAPVFNYGNMVAGDAFYLVLNVKGSRNAAIGNPGGTAEAVADVILDDGDWHHVALVHDGKTARLFVDANEETRIQRRYSTSAATKMRKLQLGGDCSVSIDDFVVVSRALNAGGISRLMVNGITSVRSASPTTK